LPSSGAVSFGVFTLFVSMVNSVVRQRVTVMVSMAVQLEIHVGVPGQPELRLAVFEIHRAVVNDQVIPAQL
jgi:hypothetical protein